MRAEVGLGGAVAWGVFAAVVLGCLALDLLVIHRRSRETSLRASIGWSVVWVSVGLTFNLWVWWAMGPNTALEFLTGYLVEKALSVDNLFVISVIFTSLQIPRIYQHRVLFWGILGALVIRGGFIAVGVEVLHLFHWTMLLMGAFLVYTGLKLMAPDDPDGSIQETAVVRWARRTGRLTDEIDGEKFFVKQGGRWFATRLFLALLVVETTDVVFAVDSVPAVLGITQDPFVVYTSNVFAILGLRALYSVLADVVTRFHYMKHGLSLILVGVGVKMMIADWVHVPTAASLGSIIGILTLAGLASWARERQLAPERQRFAAQHPSHTAGSAPERGAFPPADGSAAPETHSAAERVMLLHRVPAFRGLALEDLRLVADDLYVLRCHPGDAVFFAGDDGDALYVVVQGRVGIYRGAPGAEVLLATLGPDESFGEMALFDAARRSATVRALEETQLLALAREPFQRLGSARPSVLIEIIRVLSERLRQTDERLARGEAEVPSERAGG